MVLAAAAIAAGAFYVGAYFFPHPRTPVVSEPVSQSAAPESATLESFGIGLTGSAAPSTESSSTPPGTVLDAQALASLEAPATGRLIGQYAGPGDADDTIVVRVLDFSALVPDASGTPTRRTLPRGVPVTLVLAERPAGAPPVVLPEPGATVQADIRIEPARGDLPGRIVAVNVVVPGAKQ